MDALLGHLHCQGDAGPGRDRVESVLVAVGIELHEGLDVVDAAVRAAKRDRLVLGTLSPCARHGVEVAARDGALVAGSLLDADLLERLRVDLVCTLERSGGVVARRQGAAAVDNVDEDRGPFFVGPQVVVGEDVLLVDAPHIREEGAGVADCDPSRASYRNRLQVLCAHDCPGPARPALWYWSVEMQE